MLCCYNRKSHLNVRKLFVFLGGSWQHLRFVTSFGSRIAAITMQRRNRMRKVLSSKLCRRRSSTLKPPILYYHFQFILVSIPWRFHPCVAKLNRHCLLVTTATADKRVRIRNEEARNKFVITSVTCLYDLPLLQHKI